MVTCEHVEFLSMIIIEETIFVAAVHDKLGKFEACGKPHGGSACGAIELPWLGGRQDCWTCFTLWLKRAVACSVAIDGSAPSMLTGGCKFVYTRGVTAGRIHVLQTMIRPDMQASASMVVFATSMDSRIVLQD